MSETDEKVHMLNVIWFKPDGGAENDAGPQAQQPREHGAPSVDAGRFERLGDKVGEKP